MAYQDIGFDEFLQRTDQASGGGDVIQYDPLQTDTLLSEISGNKIVGGLISSPDGRMKINVEDGYLVVNNGIIDLFRLGILDDGSVGLLMQNGDGKTLLRFTEKEQYMQSPNEHFQADFIKERILAKDEKGVPRALFGKGDF